VSFHLTIRSNLVLDLFLLSNILEIITPVWVYLITPASEPLFGSFGAYQGASSVGFLVSYTPKGSEESILFLDFPSREPHDSTFFRRGIISLKGSLVTKVEVRSTTLLPATTKISPNQTSVLARNLAIGSGSRDSLSLVPGSFSIESPRQRSREREVLRRGIFKTNVMIPGPEDKGKPRIPSEEGRLGNDRNPLRVGLKRRVVIGNSTLLRYFSLFVLIIRKEVRNEDFDFEGRRGLPTDSRRRNKDF